jgi:hypothetical protein
MNRAALYEYVRGYVDQDNVTLPDAVLDVMVNGVEGELNRALQEHPRMRSRQSWTLQDGDNIIPLPQNLLTLNALKSNGVTYRQRSVQSSTPTSGRSFVNHGNCLEVYPAASGPTTYTLECALLLPSITGAPPADKNWVSENHADLYRAGLLEAVFGFVRDAQSQAAHRQSFMAKLQSLRASGWSEGLTRGARVV